MWYLSYTYVHTYVTTARVIASSSLISSSHIINCVNVMKIIENQKTLLINDSKYVAVIQGRECEQREGCGVQPGQVRESK